MVAWRSSKDGVTFSPLAPAIVGKQGHASFVDVLLVGYRIYLTEARFGYWRSKAGFPTKVEGKMWWHRDRSRPDRPNFYSPHEVFPFDIISNQLKPGKVVAALPGDQHIGHAGPHYGSITRDTNGHLWVAARAQWPEYGRLATWVAPTTRPYNVSAWESHTVLFESKGPGTHAPQILVLDEGRVACILFTKHEQMTTIFLYDPDSRTWDGPQVIGKGYERKRVCAVFDSRSRCLHIVYIAANEDARHRVLTALYQLENWLPPLDVPGNFVADNTGTNPGNDDLSLSANLSQDPAFLALVHRGPDLRLHLKYDDGEKWVPKGIKIGIQR